LLLDRFATLLGVDPTSLDRSASSPNESLGVEEVEMLRRVNLHAPEEEDAPKRQLLIKQVLADSILAARPDARKFAPPPEEQPWVVERGTAMVAALRAASYDVVGDLDELVPPLTTPDGADPDDVDDSAVARVAVETMAAVLHRSHELEAQRLTTQVASLKQRLEVRNSRVETLEQRAKTLEQRAKTLDQRAKTLDQRAKTLGQRVKTLEQQLQTARQAFRDERAQPLSVHLRRRAGLVKRRLVRQPPP
jgi:chaperonin cofactor prefoldin